MTRIKFVSADDVRMALDQVAEHLHADGLVAYPTETVYGFGSLLREKPLRALAELKSRDKTKPFLLLIEEAADIPALVWTSAARRLAQAFWPGPLTLALRVRADFPLHIISAEGTVAVRATPHAGIRALLHRLGEPMTSTSANAPGHRPAANADEVEAVLRGLGHDNVLILDGGALPHSAPSTLVDCSCEPPRITRPGAITAEALNQVVEVA